ncbi:MAG: ferredoxin--NADP reductase [Candidatus Omnitrophica bacterium]|nr:ferredoxin--NADP reductase [Candidatus Omnitrophota bacterium]
MAVKELNAIITQKVEVAPGLIVIRVAPDGWDLPEFTPGQFAVLGLPANAPRCAGSDPEEDPLAKPDKMIQRAYSVASSSVAKEYLEFYVALVHSGGLTPRLFHLKIGDRLWLGPKFKGFFTLDEVPPESNVVLIATGTGLAPYVSMLRSQLIGETQRKFAVVHGARHSWDLGYSSELTLMETMSPMLSYFPIITRPKDEPAPWAGLTGRVQEVWASGALKKAWGFHPAPKDTHVFLCGNPGMIETMEGILQAEGFAEHTRKSPGQYHAEKYW